jgi:phosphatidylserine synthase
MKTKILTALAYIVVGTFVLAMCAIIVATIVKSTAILGWPVPVAVMGLLSLMWATSYLLLKHGGPPVK